MRDGLPRRIGLLAIPTASALVLTFLLLRGPLPDPTTDPAGWTEVVTSGAYSGWSSAVLNGLVWMIFGFIAWQATLAPRLPDRTAQVLLFFGCAWGIAACAVGLAVVGVMRMAWIPLAEAGDAATAATFTETLTWRVWVPFSLASAALSGLLMAAALARNQDTRFLALFWVVAGIALALPMYHYVWVAGWGALLLGSLPMAVDAWRQDSTVMPEHL